MGETGGGGGQGVGAGRGGVFSRLRLQESRKQEAAVSGGGGGALLFCCRGRSQDKPPISCAATLRPPGVPGDPRAALPAYTAQRPPKPSPTSHTFTWSYLPPARFSPLTLCTTLRMPCTCYFCRRCLQVDDGSESISALVTDDEGTDELKRRRCSNLFALRRTGERELMG